jgi:GTPase
LASAAATLDDGSDEEKDKAAKEGKDKPAADGNDEIGDISQIPLSKEKKFFDVRVAVVGNVDSGKSTLVGVLTGGQLDNGRGQARSRVRPRTYTRRTRIPLTRSLPVCVFVFSF